MLRATRHLQYIIMQFQLGEWQVSPADNTLIKGRIKRTVEPKAMDVLLLLCQHSSEVISTDRVIEQCWPETDIGDNPLHKVITQLRRALNDKANAPQYIQTVRKRGYRIVAEVTFPPQEKDRAAKTVWHGKSPFPGLQAFTEAQAEVFFGRSSAVNQLLSRVERQRKQRQMLTLILGPSGSGKSSLVYAGLLPRLKHPKGCAGIRVLSDARLDAADIVSGNIFLELACVLMDLEIDDQPIFSGYSSEQLAGQLENEPEQVRQLYEQQIKREVSGTALLPACLLVVDKLEAIFADKTIPAATKNQYFQCLNCLAAGDNFLIYLICRNDFYPDISAFDALMQHKNTGSHFDLQAPTGVEIGQMIRLPALAAGLTWEIHPETGVSLDEQLSIDAVNHADGLPLLQYTLQQLYLQRTADTLQYATYDALGGVEGAVGVRAEALFTAQSRAVQAAFSSIMSHIIRVGQGGEQLTSTSVQWQKLTTQEEKTFVEVMVDARLFVSHLHQGKACFNVAHEALLRRWTRVTTWVAEHQQALAIKARVYHQAMQWIADNHSRAFLLSPGKPLDEARLLAAQRLIPLDSDELALVRASEKQAYRKKWFRRSTLIALAALSVVSFLSMLSSMQAQSLAEQKRLEAENLMGFMIGDFADTLRNVKRMDLLEGISEKALSYVEQSIRVREQSLFLPSPPLPSFNLRLQHALSLQASAEVSYYRDDADKAERLYQEAGKRLNALLAEFPAHTDLLAAKGVNAFWLGHLSYKKDDLDDAKTHMQEYLSTSQTSLALNPNSIDAQYEITYAYNSLGSIELKQGEYQRALEHFQKALELRLALSQTNTPPPLIDIADTRSWIASSLIHIGNYQEALNNYQEAEALVATALAETPDNANALETLAYIKTQSAELLYFTAKRRTVLEKLEEADEALRKMLAQDPSNSNWLADKRYVAMFKLRVASEQLIPTEIAQLRKRARELYTELPQDSAENAILLQATEVFHNLQLWQWRDEIIDELGDRLSLADTQNYDDIYNADDAMRFIMSAVRQAVHHQQYEVQRNYCEKLIHISKYTLSRSKIPTAYIAKVFAETCTNKTEDVTTASDQLDSYSLLAPAMPDFIDQGVTP